MSEPLPNLFGQIPNTYKSNVALYRKTKCPELKNKAFLV